MTQDSSLRTKIKICGLRESENILQVAELMPDFVGFIFYQKSKRYAGKIDPDMANNLPEVIKKVGVFVNAEIKEILIIKQKLTLDYVQLHGTETEEFCEELTKHGIKIIKAFGMSETFDFEKLDKYEAHCDYFLFDTKSEQYGGTGKKFNWQALRNYKGNTPFLLSGGIGIDDLEAIKEIKEILPQMAGVDLNSRFEIKPGIKDINLIKRFTTEAQRVN